jgi:hypothetical protein
VVLLSFCEPKYSAGVVGQQWLPIRCRTFYSIVHLGRENGPVTACILICQHVRAHARAPKSPDSVLRPERRLNTFVSTVSVHITASRPKGISDPAMNAAARRSCALYYTRRQSCCFAPCWRVRHPLWNGLFGLDGAMIVDWMSCQFSFRISVMLCNSRVNSLESVENEDLEPLKPEINGRYLSGIKFSVRIHEFSPHFCDCRLRIAVC